MADIKVKIGKIELTLQDGTMVRFIDEEPYYFDIGIQDNGNKVLFYYDPATEAADYIETIISRLPDAPSKYLENVLNTNKNILVRLFYLCDDESGFEIYYDCDELSVEFLDISNWIMDHNDWAEYGEKYTEICGGHQTVCKIN